MKMKSFMMLAMSGLLAVFVCYAAPAMAEAGVNPDPSVNTNELNNGSRDTTALSANNTNNAIDAGGSHVTDQGGPDTVSGDDDY